MSHSQLSLSTLVMEYLSKNHRISWSTRSMTKRAFRYLIEAIGDIEAARVDYANAEDFQDHLLKKGLNRTSANSFVKTTRPAFSWAVRRQYIEKNPFENLSLFRIPQQQIHTFTPAEVQAILDSATDLWRARILAAVSAGLRRGEVLNTTFDDIDFERQIITVRPKKNEELTWEWMPKNKESRMVPLSPKLNNLLVMIQMELPVGQPYPFLTEKRYWTLKQRIGSIPERVRICPDENFARPFKKILHKANVKKGTFHDLRKTCLTEWSKTMPYQELQQLAGHSDIQTTLEYYSAVSPDYLDRARQSSVLGATGLEPATS